MSSTRQVCGIVEITWRSIIEVTGRDRVRWLHNLCTQDILLLATGRHGSSFGKSERVRLDRTPSGPGCYAAIVSRQGKMIAECKVRLLEDRILIETELGNGLMDALKPLIIMEDVILADRTADFTLLGLHGPQSPATLERTLGPVPKLADFHHVQFGNVLISPFAMTGQPGFDLMAPAREGLRSRILDGGATPMTPETLERLRIENGFPRWGMDMDSSVLPMEAGLEPIAISYAKGCYIGQEVIQRVKTYSESPRQLVLLELSSESAPPKGTPIHAGDAPVGHVTSAAGLVALGYVRKEHKTPGTAVTVGSAPAIVRRLPWQERMA